MIQLFLGTPFADLGGFSASAADTSFASVGEQQWRGGGALAVEVPLSRRDDLTVVLATGLSLQTMRFSVDRFTFDGTTWELPVEVGGTWTYSEGVVQGFGGAGGGLRLRVGLPDYAAGAYAFGLGGYGVVGARFGAGAVRPLLALRADLVLSAAYVSGRILLPDATVDWGWSPSALRGTVLVGVAFGGPRREEEAPPPPPAAPPPPGPSPTP